MPITRSPRPRRHAGDRRSGVAAPSPVRRQRAAPARARGRRGTRHSATTSNASAASNTSMSSSTHPRDDSATTTRPSGTRRPPREAPEIAHVDAGRRDAAATGAICRTVLLLVTLLQPERSIGSSRRRLARRSRERELLSVPSPEMAAMVRQDPLGLLLLMRDQLPGAAASLTIDASGGYVTKDGRSRLVLARPGRPPFDIDFSRPVRAARDDRTRRWHARTPRPATTRRCRASRSRAATPSRSKRSARCAPSRSGTRSARSS